MTQVIELKEVEEKEQTVSSPYDIPYVPPSTQRVHWIAAIFIITAHLIALAGLFTFSWQALFLCLALHWVTGGLGITLGFHRLLTHRSFKVPRLVEYFFALCGSLACQGGPITWVTTHRVHHSYSDQDRDPHSPLVSFFWAHMGWCLKGNLACDDKKVQARVAPDLVQNPFYRFMENSYILWTILLGIGLYALGGWPFVTWGIFVRLVLVYHCTWFVNSATHVWGYQTYQSDDKSTNLWWVALLTYGEGWHNNHHAFQYSARHGLQWWEFDSTYLMIKFLEFMRLAKAVKLPTQHLLQSKRL